MPFLSKEISNHFIDANLTATCITDGNITYNAVIFVGRSLFFAT